MNRVWMIRIGHPKKHRPYYLPHTFETKASAVSYKQKNQSWGGNWYVVKMEEKNNGSAE